MRNLSRKYFVDDLVVSPSWISNGEFAVRKDALKDPALHSADMLLAKLPKDIFFREYTDERVERTYPGGDIIIHRTRHMWDDKDHGDLVRFDSDDGEWHVYFKRLYVDIIPTEVLQGGFPDKAWADPERRIIVMPCKMGSETD